MGIGYVHAREGQNRKVSSFEIIVGKSTGEEQPSKRFGFVNDYDTKPKRRVYETLKAQGMQMNQHAIIFSDGGDDVRNLQLYLNPFAEHVLDWFHITMRLTVLGQRCEPKSRTGTRKSALREKRRNLRSACPRWRNGNSHLNGSSGICGMAMSFVLFRSEKRFKKTWRCLKKRTLLSRKCSRL
jgi:hypothetical protein